MAENYSYDPQKLEDYGKDLMRFQLGDTMVEGKEETCAFSDAEYEAVLSMYKLPKQWKHAKLACLESICRRFAYEPDTKTGPVSFSFGARAKLWREDYEKLKAELKKSAISVGAISAQADTSDKGPYFYTGMMSTIEGQGGNK